MQKYSDLPIPNTGPVSEPSPAGAEVVMLNGNWPSSVTSASLILFRPAFFRSL